MSSGATQFRAAQQTNLAKWKENTLEERCRLIHGLLYGHVRVHAQLLVFLDLFPDVRQQHVSVEALRVLGVQVGGENLGGCVDGVGRPFVGFGQFQDGRPGGNGGQNLERFGKGAGFVSGQQLAHSVCLQTTRRRPSAHSFCWREANTSAAGLLCVSFDDFVRLRRCSFGFSGLLSFVRGDLGHDQISKVATVCSSRIAGHESFQGCCVGFIDVLPEVAQVSGELYAHFRAWSACH